MDSQELQRELSDLVLAIVAGEATADQRSRLEHLIQSDQALALHVVQLLHQEAWLGQQYVEDHGKENLDTLLSNIRPVVKDGPPSPDSPLAPTIAASTVGSSTELPRSWGSRMGWLAAAVLLSAGAIGGSLLTRWVDQSRGNSNRVAVAKDTTPSAVAESPYVAKFVQDTACIWEPGGATPKVGAGNLHAGESFNLMEGLAEIELNFATAGNATLAMEGPARMMLTSDGRPSLTQGRFTSRIYPRADRVAFDMPFGRVRVLEETSLGIAVNGLDVEIHVFTGRVAIDCPWFSKRGITDKQYVESGERVRIFVDEDRMAMQRDGAKPWEFTTQSTMLADLLEVPDEYVDEVLEASPIVYWRFDEVADGIVRNLADDRYHGVVHGSPAWSHQGDNQAIEFGMDSTAEAQHSYIEADAPLQDELGNSYTVECWVKPSHYHLGSLVSLFREPGDHGVLIELGGTLATPSIIEHAGQFRFLHRNPPSGDVEAGTSCFSDVPYEARRWAHLVSVKDTHFSRLYVNGKLVSEVADSTPLADNLTLLIAQLDRSRQWRPFIGQLDEIAVYPQPLKDEEVLRHYELVRPEKAELPDPI